MHSAKDALQLRWVFRGPHLQSRLDDVKWMQQQHSRRACHATSNHMLPALTLLPLRRLLLLLLLACMVLCLLFCFFGGHAAVATATPNLEGSRTERFFLPKRVLQVTSCDEFINTC
jgi:hypothetical protein